MRKQGESKRGSAPPPVSSELIRSIVARLEARYGEPKWRERQDPVDELISCILSQHTSDVNSLRAFADLKSAYTSWEAVMEARVGQLANVIRSGGLANNKAARIQQVLQQLKEDQGDINLDSLSGMTDAEARDYLMGLPGVGPKTAAIVLCFALGRNVMPVDTHVFRVAWRLGLIEKRIGEARAHDVLQALVPDELTYRYHVATITHGRAVCKAPIPRCAECVLTDMCWWYTHESRNIDTH